MLPGCRFGRFADPCDQQGLTCSPGPSGYLCGERSNAPEKSPVWPVGFGRLNIIPIYSSTGRILFLATPCPIRKPTTSTCACEIFASFVKGGVFFVHHSPVHVHKIHLQYVDFSPRVWLTASLFPQSGGLRSEPRQRSVRGR